MWYLIFILFVFWPLLLVSLTVYLVSGKINPSVTDQYLIPLWATKTCMIIFIEIWDLCHGPEYALFWLSVFSVFENNFYSALVRWNILWMSETHKAINEVYIIESWNRWSIWVSIFLVIKAKALNIHPIIECKPTFF